MERCINVGMILDIVNEVSVIWKKGIKLTNKFVEWLSYDVVKDQECKDCSFFPVCYGGCAAYKNKICSSVKWNAEEMLELMKEMAQ